jgi:hypothetical protein
MEILKLSMEKWPAQLAMGLLILLILPLPYSFYMLVKIPIFVAAVYYCIKLYQKDKKQFNDFWYMLIIAIIFNPLLPIHLFYRLLWMVVDIVAVVYFFKFYKRL